LTGSRNMIKRKTHIIISNKAGKPKLLVRRTNKWHNEGRIKVRKIHYVDSGKGPVVGYSYTIIKKFGFLRSRQHLS
jgi:hypothetical protein